MKLYLSIVLIFFIAGIVADTPTSESATFPKPDSSEEEPFQTLHIEDGLQRYRKSCGYKGGATMPRPPCPKSYVVSCAISLSTVSCNSGGGSGSGGGGSCGSSGAYTAPVPVYVDQTGYTFNLLLP